MPHSETKRQGLDLEIIFSYFVERAATCPLPAEPSVSPSQDRLKMNKTQLIESISSEAGISRGEAKRSLEAFMKITTAALISGEKVTLAGFGTFAIERKHARTGRDPRNGAPIRIAAKNVVKFRPGTELSEAVK